MKIGVISDTHLKKYDARLEKIVADHFKDVEMVLHAGDIVTLDVLDVFRGKKLYVVSGNMDSDIVRKNFPAKEILKVEGFKIGLIHGWGVPEGIEKRVAREFDDIDCLVYGHSHRAVTRKTGNILFFNPGSPTDRIYAPFNSIGLLDITDRITGTVISLDE